MTKKIIHVVVEGGTTDEVKEVHDMIRGGLKDYKVITTHEKIELIPLYNITELVEIVEKKVKKSMK